MSDQVHLVRLLLITKLHCHEPVLLAITHPNKGIIHIITLMIQNEIRQTVFCVVTAFVMFTALSAVFVIFVLHGNEETSRTNDFFFLLCIFFFCVSDGRSVRKCQRERERKRVCSQVRRPSCVYVFVVPAIVVLMQHLPAVCVYKRQKHDSPVSNRFS